MLIVFSMAQQLQLLNIFGRELCNSLVMVQRIQTVSQFLHGAKAKNTVHYSSECAGTLKIKKNDFTSISLTLVLGIKKEKQKGRLCTI